jgi:hypothetical protein
MPSILIVTVHFYSVYFCSSLPPSEYFLLVLTAFKNKKTENENPERNRKENELPDSPCLHPFCLAFPGLKKSFVFF